MSGMRGKDGGHCISVCEMIDKAKKRSKRRAEHEVR